MIEPLTKVHAWEMKRCIKHIGNKLSHRLSFVWRFYSFVGIGASQTCLQWQILAGM